MFTKLKKYFLLSTFVSFPLLVHASEDADNCLAEEQKMNFSGGYSSQAQEILTSQQKAFNKLPQRAQRWVDRLNQENKNTFLSYPKSLLEDLLKYKFYFLQEELNVNEIVKVIMGGQWRKDDKSSAVPVSRDLFFQLLGFYAEGNERACEKYYFFLSKPMRTRAHLANAETA